MIRQHKSPFFNFPYDMGSKKKDAPKGPQTIRVHNFNTSAVNRFRRELEQALNMEQEIIPVVIDSYGGTVYSLLAMLDLVEEAKKHACVPTVVEGKAMSCGAILFSAGTEGHRYASPNATVMIHDVSSMSFGKSGDLEADAAEVKRLNKIIYETMARNVGHEDVRYFYDLVQQRGRSDWYLTPNDCKKHKLANKVKLPSLDVIVDVKVKFG
jgi:ATP-dependent Clp protease protease subunit